MNTNNLKNDMNDGLNNAGNAVGLTAAEEPTTGHDAKEGGIIGAVGGAVVGMLAGGPVGAIIGAIAGGAASAAAVNAVDKHDHDYNPADTAASDTTAYATDNSVINDPDNMSGTATEYTGPGDYQRVQAAPAIDSYAAPVVESYGTPAVENYGTPATEGYSAPATSTFTNDTDQKIQLHQEELHASTQAVQTGEVTLRKEVITEMQSIDVPVTREEVVIERHTVSGAVPSADFGTQAEEVLRVPVMEEQITVQKTPVVTEEITLGKRQVTETQHITDTVRHEEARIENPDNVDVLQRGQIGSEVDEDDRSVSPASSSAS